MESIFHYNKFRAKSCRKRSPLGFSIAQYAFKKPYRRIKKAYRPGTLADCILENGDIREGEWRDNVATETYHPL